MRIFLFLFLFCFYFASQSQNKILLKGKVVYKNTNVEGINIINNNDQTNTITNNNGEFEINVAEGDKLIFSSVQFHIKTITITKEIIANNRLLVEVNVRMNFLDEVVVSPENTEKFLNLKEEEFKNYDYTADKSTKIKNRAARNNTLEDGLNFTNIYRLLKKRFEEENKEQDTKVSQALPLIFEDSFFTKDLGLAIYQIDGFLLYLDKKKIPKDVLTNERKFELIDILISESINYKKILEKNINN